MSSTSNLYLGHIEVKECLITSTNGDSSLNFFDQVQAFDIFEDISKPTLYAEIFVNDSINLLSGFPLIGEENISITFRTSEAVDVTYNFRVFEITNIAKQRNGRSVNYLLRCVSAEHFFNSNRYITQVYEGNVSDMVPDVLAKYLNSKKPIVLDPTKGTQTIVVPRMTPLQFIDFCRHRAVSNKYPSSSYVFFENQDGFHFKTVESLVEEGVKNIGSRVFEYKLASTIKNDPSKYADQYRTLQSYEIVQSVDSIERMTGGTYKAVSKKFDITTKQIITTEFDLRSELDKFTFPNKKEKIQVTNDFINQHQTLTPLQFFRFETSLVPQNYIDSSIALRNSYRQILNSNFVRIKVHGDSGLKVGSIIALNVPLSSGFDKAEEEPGGKNYLVLRLRHVINGGASPTHQITIDCTRVS